MSDSKTQSKAILEPKIIRSIIDKNYFIPDYQRGYRWKEVQVTQLLEDIYNFESKNLPNNEQTWYCLQPLVVKSMSSFPEGFEGNQTHEWFEVIDGQQRLTTIYLIVHFINEMFRGKQKDNEPVILYQTRKKSSAFLATLENLGENSVIEYSNIDYYHISSAYIVISKWFEENSINSDLFISKFYDLTKVIWYETFEDHAIEIFKRLNTGKIDLTNAELVKALFLNSSNFSNDEATYHKQLQIASDWENIEYSLHNDDFWLFINKEENKISTRIEFLLDIFKNKPENNDNEYYTFSEFFEEFKNKKENYIIEKWHEIKQTYLVLLEWFNTPILHNKIGFLIFCDLKDVTINTILEKYNTMNKDRFEIYLNLEIKSFLKGLNVDLEKIEFKNNQGTFRKILLLHNIETMNQNKSNESKFPFKKLKDKTNGWDIEHISSIVDKLPTTELHRQAWLDESLPFIKDEILYEKCKKWNDENFKDLFYEVISYFNGSQNSEDTTNTLGNLTLLDSKTNRGYKNSVFPEKRRKIIEKDKNGQFIPICTKNLFMKYYSTNLNHMFFWTLQDRKDYLNNITETLSYYTNEQ